MNVVVLHNIVIEFLYVEAVFLLLSRCVSSHMRGHTICILLKLLLFSLLLLIAVLFDTIIILQ